MASNLYKTLTSITKRTLISPKSLQWRPTCSQWSILNRTAISTTSQSKRTFSISASNSQTAQSFVKHASVDHAVIRDKKLFFVGDVQGCYDELMELLDKANAVNDDTVIFFVGDMLNRGPKNLEVLNFLVEQSLSMFAVRGNHEDIILQEHRMLKESSDYTLKPHLQWIDDIDSKGIDYLKSLPFTIALPSLNMIVVHAGLVPGKDLSQQEDNDMLRIRTLIHTDKGYVAKDLSDSGEGTPWASTWKGPERVIFGHDAARGLQLHEHAVGLDTGCVYGRQLTGLLLTEDRAEFVTVKAHDIYVNPFG